MGGLHPNDRGHAIFAAKIIPQVMTILDSGSEVSPVLLQQLAWDAVIRHPFSGVTPRPPAAANTQLSTRAS